MFITLYNFHVYNVMFQLLYTLQCVHHQKEGWWFESLDIKKSMSYHLGEELHSNVGNTSTQAHDEILRASPVELVVKKLLMQETPGTWVRSMGRKDPLETEMATHSSIPAWEIPWTEEPGGYSPQGGKEPDTAETEACCTWCSWYTITACW